jgi:undecaprenyl pyrophosphate phosphatase UppP
MQALLCHSQPGEITCEAMHIERKYCTAVRTNNGGYHASDQFVIVFGALVACTCEAMQMYHRMLRANRNKRQQNEQSMEVQTFWVVVVCSPALILAPFMHSRAAVDFR